MKSIRTECEAIEKRAKAAGLTVDAMCSAAGISRATWQRWKAETTSPKLMDWQRVLAAVPAPAPAPSEAAA